MRIIRSQAFARAGLIGNPSDGYHGKTISIIVRNYRAQTTLYEWDRIEIVNSRNDESSFRSLEEFSEDVRRHGYYGGIRLVKAAIHGFVEYCRKKAIALHDRNFSIRYESTIPRQVGLAGSSAIIVATFRALMEFYGVTISQNVLPSLVLSIERDRLGIQAGLQDRVIQVYEGAVFMDFSKESEEIVDGFVCGRYVPINPAKLPPLYLAHSAQYSEPTEVFHNNLRFRFDQGEPEVVNAMRILTDITVEAGEAIERGDTKRLGELLDRNFDTRRSICRLPKEHIEMVETARGVGASAKFSGSGGAIIGTYDDETVYKKLVEEMKKIGCTVIKPLVCPDVCPAGVPDRDPENN
ncbi:MAG TPA: GHMP kinase [Planctomycetaceae bacterium]|nr:GHMP kinase [Planctomycetaceae bacterium]